MVTTYHTPAQVETIAWRNLILDLGWGTTAALCNTRQHGQLPLLTDCWLSSQCLIFFRPVSAVDIGY